MSDFRSNIITDDLEYGGTKILSFNFSTNYMKAAANILPQFITFFLMTVCNLNTIKMHKINYHINVKYKPF